MKSIKLEVFEIGKAIPLLYGPSRQVFIIIPTEDLPATSEVMCYGYKLDSDYRGLWWKHSVAPELYSLADKIDPEYKKPAIMSMFSYIMDHKRGFSYWAGE